MTQSNLFFIPGVQRKVTRRAEEETTSPLRLSTDYFNLACCLFFILIDFKIKAENAIPKRVTFVRNFDPIGESEVDYHLLLAFGL